MSLKGHLGTIALPELLQWLAIGQKTGTLVIVKDEGVHRIVVDRGRIISTSTSDKQLQLGVWLRRKGLVDEATLERAGKLREATGMSLGRVLLTLQALAEDDLRAALRDKAEALISMLFHSTNASFQFVEDGDLGDPGVALSLDATQLVLSAAHHLEQQTEAGQGASVGTPSGEGRSGATVPAPRRPTPEKATATVIETLPEHTAATPESGRRPAPAPLRGRRRAVGGLAAAAVLIAAVAAVLVIGRSHVPAKAEESVDRVTGAALDLAPLAVGDLAASATDAERPPSRAPAVVPPQQPPAETGVEAAGFQPARDPAPPLDEERMERLLAKREAELRGEYRAELEELRRQLAVAQSPAAPVDVAEVGAPGEPETLSSSAEQEPTGTGPDELDIAVDAAAIEPPPSGPAASRGGVADEAPEDSDTGASAALTPLLDSPSADSAVAAGGEPTVSRTAARLISRQPPLYPAAAQRLGREASVALRVLVGADGRVVEIESVGRKVGLGFDEAARTAARQSRWRPATENGAPVSSWVDLRFDFELP